MVSKRLCVLFVTLLGFTGALTATPANAASTLFVNDDAGASTPGGTTCDTAEFSTIADAVAAAADGDTIEVCAGTYALATPVVVDKSLTINGANAGISPNTPGNGIVANPVRVPESTVEVTGGTIAFAISDPDVTLDGLRFIDTTVAQADVQNGIIFAGPNAGGDVDRLAVVNNLFDSIQRVALFINGPREAPTDGATIDDNRLQDPTRPDSGCNTAPTGAPGSCARALFNPWETNDMSFQRNVAVASDGNLDRVRTANFAGSEDVIVADNIVHYTCHFTCFGVARDATDMEITRNEFVSHHGNGVAFFQGSVPDPFADWLSGNVTVHHNTFDISNGDYGVAIDNENADLDDVHINRNAFNDPTKAVRNGDSPATPGTDTVDAECNWYGSPDGPDPSDFFGPADFTPWLTSADLDGQCPRAASISDARVREGNRGTKPMTFTVTLGAPAAGGETVDFETVDGSAKAPQDYVATQGTLTFATGETSQTITVQIRGDRRDERRRERFTVVLSNPTGGLVLGDATGVGTIRDND